MKPRTSITTFVVMLMLCSVGNALGPYSIDRLKRESDIAVICTVQSSSIVPNDSGYGPETTEMFRTRIRPIVYTHGTATETELVVRHFGVKHNHGKGTGGKARRYIRFVGPSETESETSFLPGPDQFYMMYLKRDGDEFVPTSGQRDARDSIIPLQLTRNQARIQRQTKNDG
ncbi:hypothetical protein Mal33_11300 [Rosistilla oblonga]|uniref:Uncharacterized protein n=1 Tax=Rosistilla oblonga TaxID=2527990 RepID=A0A518IPY9_9BACT|nr:hypothetical protein Mal33_11300 [Rosistilla oblonga]